MTHAQKRTLLAVAVVTLLTAACAKKVAVGPPPPPAPGPTPAVASKPAPPPPVHAAAAERPAATTPAPKNPNAETRDRIDPLLAKIEDAYFVYDKTSRRPDSMKALQADSTELRDNLKDYPDNKLTIEGHCDE